jgi:hypothetical protein
MACLADPDGEPEIFSVKLRADTVQLCVRLIFQAAEL